MRLALLIAVTLVTGASGARDVLSPTDLVAIDLSGRQTNLTHDPGSDMSPAVSHDGRIVFLSTREGRADLYVMDRAGSGVRRLTASPFDESEVSWENREITQASWSADGTRIAFDTAATTIPVTCLRNCVEWNVHVVDADGTNLRRVASSARAPAWSPAGRSLAYESGYGSYERATSGLTIARGSRPVELRALNVDPQEGPVWSPNGRQIAFEAAAASGRPKWIYLVDADGRKKRRLAVGRDPTWSPDGHSLAFIRDSKLFAIRADGKGKRLLSREGELVYDAAWSPKGNLVAAVAASSAAPQSLRVETFSAAGKRVHVLARERAGTQVLGTPVWTPDGKRIIVAVG